MKGIKGFQKGNKFGTFHKGQPATSGSFKKGHKTNVGRVFSKDRNIKISKNSSEREAPADESTISIPLNESWVKTSTG